MIHGTVNAYNHHGCRCSECRGAMRRAAHARNSRGMVVKDRHLMRDLLGELFPLGLTPDCPVRKANQGSYMAPPS